MWLFGSVPKGYWRNLDNQHRVIEWVGEQLSIHTYDGWYRVNTEQFASNGGSSLMNYYHDTYSRAIMSILSEYPWNEWMFGVVPQGHWNNIKCQQDFMSWFAVLYNIHGPTDWYRVKQGNIREKAPSLMLKYRGSLMKLLETVYQHQQRSIMTQIDG